MTESVKLKEGGFMGRADGQKAILIKGLEEPGHSLRTSICRLLEQVAEAERLAVVSRALGVHGPSQEEVGPREPRDQVQDRRVLGRLKGRGMEFHIDWEQKMLPY